jgi:Kinesin motor domain
VSLLEVYNEEIRDLLVAGGSTEKLEVRQSDLGNHVPGLTVMAVQDLQDVFDLLTLADSNRSQGKYIDSHTQVQWLIRSMCRQ